MDGSGSSGRSRMDASGGSWMDASGRSWMDATGRSRLDASGFDHAVGFLKIAQKLLGKF